MKNKYSRDLVEKLVNESISYSQVVKKLGFTKSGGSPHRWVRKLIQEYSINTSHFQGQSWAKGMTGDTHPGIRKLEKEEIFKEDSHIVGTKLRKHYLKLVPDDKCAICNIEDWNGKPIKFHIDHINGINNDNRIENLRWICPNCHQQTSTWGWSKYRATNKNISSDRQ